MNTYVCFEFDEVRIDWEVGDGKGEGHLYSQNQLESVDVSCRLIEEEPSWTPENTD